MIAADGRAKLVVNDRADVARAANADGVHLRGDGSPAPLVRSLAPVGWTITKSIHSAAEAAKVRGADVLLFGTVFPSRSKPVDTRVAGTAELAAVVSAAGAAVLAIGGVTAANVALCRASGAAGVAAIEMFLSPGTSPFALGPARAVEAIRAAWDEVR